MDLDFLSLCGLCAAAFVAGVVDAIAGGGGLLTLPALLLAGLPAPLALGTNKGQAVFGSGTALLTFARSGKIDPARLKWLFAPGFVGSLLGAAAVTWLAPAVLRPVVLVLLVAVAAFLALRPPLQVARAPVGGNPALRMVLLALVVGAYDGFFGPGTGTFLIIGLVTLLGDDLTRGSAHAKVVNFASNLAAMLLFFERGAVVWSIALPMAVLQAAGGVVGARMAVRGGDVLVRRVVLVVVVALCARLGWDLLRG
ncbi:MAG: TSUP family transporter [Deltaproteobacteria bacterium]|nr:TSUP family transporter [Deltaproteobacteria bacterium]